MIIKSPRSDVGFEAYDLLCCSRCSLSSTQRCRSWRLTRPEIAEEDQLGAGMAGMAEKDGGKGRSLRFLSLPESPCSLGFSLGTGKR